VLDGHDGEGREFASQRIMLLCGLDQGEIGGGEQVLEVVVELASAGADADPAMDVVAEGRDVLRQPKRDISRRRDTYVGRRP
jgi:hypothetical protein